MKNLIAWVEIPATDFQRAVKFYNSILKLNLNAMDFGHEKMAFFPNDEGAISFAPNFKPSKDGVLVSLNTEDDLDGTLERVRANGGEIVQPKTKIEAEQSRIIRKLNCDLPPPWQEPVPDRIRGGEQGGRLS